MAEYAICIVDIIGRRCPKVDMNDMGVEINQQLDRAIRAFISCRGLRNVTWGPIS